MSQITMVSCTICNPGAGDYPVRKPVSVTSQELVELIKHVVDMHSNVNETRKTADEALKVARQAFSRSITQKFVE